MSYISMLLASLETRLAMLTAASGVAEEPGDGVALHRSCSDFCTPPCGPRFGETCDGHVCGLVSGVAGPVVRTQPAGGVATARPGSTLGAKRANGSTSAVGGRYSALAAAIGVAEWFSFAGDY
jgi:hypothetical protein